MEQKTQILFGGKTSALENSPVESFPVIADTKLSPLRTKVVGDFSLIPTRWIDRVQLIGSVQEGIREKGIHTKSANKGWKVTAKW